MDGEAKTGGHWHVLAKKKRHNDALGLALRMPSLSFYLRVSRITELSLRLRPA